MQEKAPGYEMVETPHWIPAKHFEFHLILYTRKRRSNQSIVDFIKRMSVQPSKSPYEIISKELDLLLLYYRQIPGNTVRNLSWKEFHSLRYLPNISKQIELFALTTQEELKPMNDIVDDSFLLRVAYHAEHFQELLSLFPDSDNIFSVFNLQTMEMERLLNSSPRLVDGYPVKKKDFNNIFHEGKIRVHSKNLQFVTNNFPVERFSPILNQLSNIARGVKTQLYVESSIDFGQKITQKSIEDDSSSLATSSGVYSYC